jgi:UDP-N-acetyl-D-mannosaminuronate dehydrogenase
MMAWARSSHSGSSSWIAAERPVKRANIGIIGITFKEDVPDLRNSGVPDIVAGLREVGSTLSSSFVPINCRY